MFALDIRDDNKYELIECDIKLPSPGSCFIVALGGLMDEYLVIGWIKELFGTDNFKDVSFPPIEIAQMIRYWYNQEEIHWLRSITEFNVHNHFSIDVGNVLKSL